MRFFDIFPMSDTILTEWRGIPAREAGSRYVNPKDPNDYLVLSAKVIPMPEQSIGKYQSKEERDGALEEFKLENDGEFIDINRPSGLGFIIIPMTDPNNKQYYFIRYMTDTYDLMGKINKIPGGLVNDNIDGYELASKSSQSEKLGIKPSDIIKDDRTYDLYEIPSLIETADIDLELKTQIQSFLLTCLDGELPEKIENGKKFDSAHQKYTGEWAGPIIVANQLFSPDIGSKLEDHFDITLSDAKVHFPIESTNALIDSELVFSNMKLGISSKAGKGASASIEGLVQSFEKAKEKYITQFTGDKQKAKDFSEIIISLKEKSAIDGVLDLSVKFGVITQDESSFIKDAKNNRDITIDDFSEDLQTLMNDMNVRTDTPNYKPFYHVMAVVSKKLCETLNDNDYTDCTKHLLNYASMVQLHFHSSPDKNDLKIKDFELVWPPSFDGDIIFDSSKNFFASDIKGKLGFKIVKSKAEINASTKASKKIKSYIDTPSKKTTTKGKKIKLTYSKSAPMGRSKKS